VFSVDFSSDGRFLVSGSLDSSVRVWCMRDGSSKRLVGGTTSFVTSVALSPDGRYVAAASVDGMLRIWNFRSKQLLKKWNEKGHDQSLRTVVFTSDGKGLLSGGQDEALKSWDVSSLVGNRSASRRGSADGCNIDEKSRVLTFQRHAVRFSFASFGF
jgi:glucose repression regulatory protein TUP1